MATASSASSEEFVTTALVRQQYVLHLIARIGARLWLVISPLGWADTPALRAVIVGFVGYDLLGARLLRQGRAPRLVVRFLLDVADVTFWALLCPANAPYSAAVVIALPVMVVAPIQWGHRRAVLAVLTVAGVPALARLGLAGAPFFGDALTYTGMQLVVGVVFVRLLRAEAARQERVAEALGQADLTAAGLAGRNDVATGAGADLIDDLQTSIMRLSAARVNAAATLRAAVAGHKRRLGEETRRGAVYLRDALDDVSAASRADQPAVARHVFFDVPADVGVRVLSVEQADRLGHQIQASGLTGVIPVSGVRADVRGTTVLDVGEQRVTLPGAQAFAVRLYVVPMAVVGLALYVLALSDPDYSDIPWRVTLPLALVFVVYAAGGVLAIRRWGPRIEALLALGTLVPFGVLVALATWLAPVTVPPRVTLIGPLAGLGLLLGMIVQPRAAVAAAWVGLLGAVAVVLVTAPAVPFRYAVAELIWPAIATIGAHAIARIVIRLSADLSTTLTAGRHARITAARRTAALGEISYLHDVLDQGSELCRRAEPGAVLTGVTAELSRLRHRLERLASTVATAGTERRG